MKKDLAGIRQLLRSYGRNEDGMGTVEMILIIVVLIGLVIIFKDSISKLVKSIMGTITERSGIVTG